MSKGEVVHCHKCLTGVKYEFEPCPMCGNGKENMNIFNKKSKTKNEGVSSDLTPVKKPIKKDNIVLDFDIIEYNVSDYNDVKNNIESIEIVFKFKFKNLSYKPLDVRIGSEAINTSITNSINELIENTTSIFKAKGEPYSFTSIEKNTLELWGGLEVRVVNYDQDTTMKPILNTMTRFAQDVFNILKVNYVDLESLIENRTKGFKEVKDYINKDKIKFT